MPAARGGAAGKKRGRGGKAAAGHQLAPTFPQGTVLTDLQKKTWMLGKAVGSGGFGLLYLTSPTDSSGEPQYVLKVEPHGNGPLFCELAFYQRVAKPDQVTSWAGSKKLKFLGVPKFIATGGHEYNGTRYRFMVMERFGTDLQKLFEENAKSFSRTAVCLLGIKMLDALEYIHEHQYVHADIKASNILMGFRKGTQDEVYLVDYGLAYRYTSDNGHKEYKEDPKRRHDGTIEFTSRDAHKGVAPSRRSDLEILGYCLLQWLCGQLPWENKLHDKDYVAAQKEKFMKDLPGSMKTCFSASDIPGEIEKYLKEVVGMKYEEKPNYTKLKQIFVDGLKKQGSTATAKLDLGAPKAKASGKATPAKASGKAPARKSTAKRKSEVFDEEEEVQSPSKVKAQARKAPAKKSAAKRRSENSEEESSESEESDEEIIVRNKANGVTPRPVDPLRPRAGFSKRGRPGTPRTPARSPSPKKVQSPAISRVKSQTLNAKARKGKVSAATQTSPSLRGLRRSRKAP